MKWCQLNYKALFLKVWNRVKEEEKIGSGIQHYPERQQSLDGLEREALMTPHTIDRTEYTFEMKEENV